MFWSATGNSQQFGWVKTIHALPIQNSNIKSDSQGNMYFTGTADDTVDLDPGPDEFYGDSGSFVMKLDSGGNLLWERTITARFASICCDPSGNILVYGVFSGTVDFDGGTGQYLMTSEDTSLFVVKIGTSGDFMWAKQLDVSILVSQFYKVRAVCTDINGNATIMGVFSGPVDFDPGNEDFNITASYPDQAFLLKLDADGNFLWVKTFDGPIGASIDMGADIYGNIYISGVYGENADLDPGPAENILSTGNYICKFDSTGNLVWAGSLGSAAHHLDMFVDPSGIVYLTGTFEVNIDLDPGPGNFEVFDSTSVGSIFISRLDSEGNLSLGYSFEGNGESEIYGNAAGLITADDAGNIYSSGWITHTTDFDPGNGVYLLNSYLPGIPRGYLLKLDSSGTFKWIQDFGNDTDVQVALSSIAVLPSGNVCSSGYMQIGELDFNVEEDEEEIVSGTPGKYFVYMIRKDSTINIINTLNKAQGNSFKIYPNPVTEILYINEVAPTISGFSVQIYDVSGRELMAEKIISDNASLHLDFLIKGIYFIKISNEDKKEIVRFIKE